MSTQEQKDWQAYSDIVAAHEDLNATNTLQVARRFIQETAPSEDFFLVIYELQQIERESLLHARTLLDRAISHFKSVYDPSEPAEFVDTAKYEANYKTV
jgi:hypothetical protein